MPCMTSKVSSFGLSQRVLLVFDNISGDSAGLLGVWNDDTTDDLLAANGTTLADSSSQETIFHEFGESCNTFFWLFIISSFNSSQIT